MRPNHGCSRDAFGNNRAPARPRWCARARPFLGVLGPKRMVRPRAPDGTAARRPLHLKTMDKKGKKTLRYPVSKVYASQAATMNLAATKPPTVSTPNGPKVTKKEPAIIDLTADSESEGTARRRNSERKVNKAFWYRLELGNPLVLNHSHPSTISGSSMDEEFLKALAEVGPSDINFVDSFSNNSQGSR
ncbi:hypothetical protein PIB30_090200 [Stylosanthes scabra]|uniref:Uncharacterized protein n=1 Tax=Stylosanthes scabra TaxID=79078 RepID=A0ABU6RUW6_9FABA|nr:hypothetical protein [Stylosanthes scabra]